MPHAPQFVPLDVRSTQTPPQLVDPAGQTQKPAEQIIPPPHVVPQPPQLRASLRMSTQLAPHSVRPAVQLAAHAPELQT